MWLVICSLNDPAALWTYQGLVSCGLSPLNFIAVESLALCSRWDHRIQATGNSTALTLADGRMIDSRSVRGTLNRVLAPPGTQLSAAVPEDRGYASQEIYSFYVSWLRTLSGPILNRPTPHGLCGAWRHISEWVCLAGRVGLPTPKYHMSSRGAPDTGQSIGIPPGQGVKTVIVIRDRVYGAEPPTAVAAGCIRLAELAGADVLGIDFFEGEQSRWTFAAATPMPDFRLGGWPLVEKLANVLKA